MGNTRITANTARILNKSNAESNEINQIWVDTVLDCIFNEITNATLKGKTKLEINTFGFDFNTRVLLKEHLEIVRELRHAGYETYHEDKYSHSYHYGYMTPGDPKLIIKWKNEYKYKPFGSDRKRIHELLKETMLIQNKNKESNRDQEERQNDDATITRNIEELCYKHKVFNDEHEAHERIVIMEKNHIDITILSAEDYAMYYELSYAD